MRVVMIAATVTLLTAAPLLAQSERGYVTGVGGFAATSDTTSGNVLGEACVRIAPNQRLTLTGAAILVFRASMSLQAVPWEPSVRRRRRLWCYRHRFKTLALAAATREAALSSPGAGWDPTSRRRRRLSSYIGRAAATSPRLACRR